MSLVFRTAVLRQIHDLLDRLLRVNGVRPPTRAHLPTTPCRPRRTAPASSPRDTDSACPVAVLAHSEAIKCHGPHYFRCAPEYDRTNDLSRTRCPSEISKAGIGFVKYGFCRIAPESPATQTTRSPV